MKAELVRTPYGDDLLVVDAARVSFDKASEWLSEAECPTDPVTGGKIPPYKRLSERDAKLIHYLAKHDHFTPFTHPVITLRETVPIFVARQRFKHTVGFSYNEVSRRYVDDEPEFFVPEVWRKRAENVKQGSSDEVVKDLHFTIEDDPYCPDRVIETTEIYRQLLKFSKDIYKLMIENDIAPEQARMVLPQSTYTSYYVTGSLYAFARAYNLRSDAHAQKEIQDLAAMWDTIIRPYFPVSWESLTNGDTQ